MSRALSPSFARCYRLARVARVWKISRASVYRSLGEQRRKALELLALPPSRHDHSDGGIPHQSGQRFEQAFHNRCRKSVERIRPIECQRRDTICFSIWMLLPNGGASS